MRKINNTKRRKDESYKDFKKGEKRKDKKYINIKEKEVEEL